MRIHSSFASFDIKKTVRIATLGGEPQMLSSNFSMPTMSRNRCVRIATSIFFLVLGTTTLADVKPSDPEIGDTPVSSITNEAAGYAVDLGPRLARFRVVDLQVDGDGGKLPIIVSRTQDMMRFIPGHRVPLELANWGLEVPKITSWRGTLRSDGVTIPLHASNNTWSSGYCHNPVYVQGTGHAATDLFWWVGLKLEIPQNGSRELVFAPQDSAGGQVVYPPINVITGVKGNAEYITVDNWRAECIDLPQGARSGFKVSAPDGTKYTFDVFASPKSKITDIMNWDDTLAAHVYASRVEDTFGNYIEYSYESDNNGGMYVSEIKGSDGRWVKFYYDVVDHTNHPFWRPKNTVKRLSRVEHVSDNGSQVLAYLEYHYYISANSEFADHGTLAAVRTPEGRFWDYSYQDHEKASSNHDPRYPPPPGYWGTKCDYGVGFTFWYCGPTFSTLPAKLTRLTTPSGASYHFDYGESSSANAWASVRGGDFNYYWPLNRLGTDMDGDGTIDWTSFDVSFSPDVELLYIDVTYPYARRDKYTFIRSTYAEGSQITKAYLKTLLGGSLTKHEVFDEQSGTAKLLKKTEFNWQSQRIVGDHARTCWIGECDKADLWTSVLLSDVREINGSTFTNTYSNFTNFDQPQTVTTSNPNVSVTNNYTYKNDEVAWIIGLQESHEVVGEGLTQRTYGTKGELRFVSEYGNDTHYEYDGNGNVSKRKWPKDAGGPLIEIRYSDYKRGLPQTTTLPTGDTIMIVVNDDGTINSETNARAFTKTLTYDALRRPIQVSHPLSAVTTIDWWGANPWEKVETTGRREDVTRRDRFDRVAWLRSRDTTSSASNVYQMYEYDEGGRLQFESRAGSYLGYPYGTEYTYDALGRVLVERDTATGREVNYCYGAACNATRVGLPPIGNGYVVTDADGYETVIDFEVYGREELLSKTVTQVKKAPLKWVTTNIVRNNLGDITSASQGGYTRQYHYTPRKLLWKYIDPETGETAFDYDLAGNIISEVVGGSAPTTFSYDDLNRMVSAIGGIGNSDVATFAYDENDNPKTVSLGRISRNYEYDAEDNVISEVLTIPGLSMQTNYEYDIHGSVTAIEYPSGWRVTYSPDAFGRPKTVRGFLSDLLARTFASNIQYDPNDSLKSFTYGNSLVYEHVDDNRSLLSKLSVRNSQLNYISHISYIYDGRANILSYTDSVAPTNSRTFGYDGMSRLLSTIGSNLTETFTYDDMGNITARSRNGVGTIYGYDAKNRLVSMSGGRLFGYDQRGNITSDGSHNLAFDAFDNLKSLSGINTESYLYDGRKRRVVKQVGADQSISAHLPSGQLMHELKRPSGETIDYIYVRDQLVASITCKASDPDADFDVIPDCYEVRWGLNPNYAGDAQSDSDGDGLTNVQEYLSSTNPLDTDSDGDYMPDGFEVEYGLNPLLDDSGQDLDGDGISNLDEYVAGSNPNFNPAWMIPILQIVLDGSST